MPSADFFRRFGFLVVRDFLDAPSCAAIRTEVRASMRAPGRIWRSPTAPAVDESARKVDQATVSAPTKSRVAARLDALRPRLESHFGVSLTHCEPPQFLQYRDGHFYEMHRDRDADADSDPTVRTRQVSVSIFLNDHDVAPRPETFMGGSLTFYGLLADSRARAIGLPLLAEAGLLVAFRADVLHAVEPVTWGERHTIVTWYG